MGNPKAFLNIPRKEAGYRPVHDRINDYGEVEQTLNLSLINISEPTRLLTIEIAVISLKKKK